MSIASGHDLIYYFFYILLQKFISQSKPFFQLFVLSETDTLVNGLLCKIPLLMPLVVVFDFDYSKSFHIFANCVAIFLRLQINYYELFLFFLKQTHPLKQTILTNF